jgi:gentisate 1,2-dioxygenase
VTVSRTGRVDLGEDPGANAAPTVLAGEATEDWAGDARFAEYTAAADPITSGVITPVPIRRFPAALHAGGPSRLVDLDCSDVLGTGGPATTPALCASFVVLEPDSPLATLPEATSELYYCLSGRGESRFRRSGAHRAPAAGAGAGVIEWAPGDVVVLPARCTTEHRALGERSVLYRVCDAPLLRYLGAVAAEARFAPTRYPAARTAALLDEVARHPDASQRSRVSVLLGNAATPDTLTATHTLWAMVGVLPPRQVQRPHRHQSVAVDLITFSPGPEGCYTLVGDELDSSGAIVDPVRVDWESGGAFITPPGLWHSHHNESDVPARLVPIQDAGLHTYLRSLDIRFAGPAS